VIRTDDLNLIATHRVHALSQRAADYLLTLVAAHYMNGTELDRETFLRMADEAEAVTK
jgi:hypothetical protein